MLNKQVYAEASGVLYGDTVWWIPKPSLLDRILVSEVLGERVRKLHLAMSHRGFVRFFGGGDEFSTASLRPLRRMRLKNLVLDFAAPGESMGVMNFETGEEERPVCQRLIVGWILEVAGRWVLGHEGVVVTGWIKDSQKNGFEKQCWEGVKEYRKWRALSGREGLEEWDEWREEMRMDEDADGGVRLVEEEGEDVSGGEVKEAEEVVGDERLLRDFRESEILMMPACFCEVSCAVEGWSAE